MAVSNETIINKMMQELNLAKSKHQNKEQLAKHVEHVKLLCELILEDDTSATMPTVPQSKPAVTSKTDITAEEMMAMMGNMKPKPGASTQTSEPGPNHGEANGDSIFDF